MKGDSREALVAAATRACAEQTQAPSCERVLVVYGRHAANLYVESKSTPSPRRTASS
ncbi:MAG TPA: hypothetical protein VGE37_08340 [Archangium sp.]